MPLDGAFLIQLTSKILYQGLTLQFIENIFLFACRLAVNCGNGGIKNKTLKNA